MRVFDRSRRGRPERRNPAYGSFRAAKKTAPPVRRLVGQRVIVELLARNSNYEGKDRVEQMMTEAKLQSAVKPEKKAK